MERDLLKYYCDRLERRIERAIDKLKNGTYTPDEIIKILEGKG